MVQDQLLYSRISHEDRIWRWKIYNTAKIKNDFISFRNSVPVLTFDSETYQDSSHLTSGSSHLIFFFLLEPPSFRLRPINSSRRAAAAATAMLSRKNTQFENYDKAWQYFCVQEHGMLSVSGTTNNQDDWCFCDKIIQLEVLLIIQYSCCRKNYHL